MIFTFVNPLQPSNASLPMLVTLLGIATDVIAVLFSKQLAYISLTVFPDSVDGTATSTS